MEFDKLFAIIVAVALIITIIVLSVLYNMKTKEINKDPNPSTYNLTIQRQYLAALIIVVLFAVVAVIYAIISHFAHAAEVSRAANVSQHR